METQPTVFVVDDDRSARRAVCDLAQRMRLPSAEYGLGEEFLSAYQLWQPGCTILEVRIPDISGLQIQSRLSAAGATIPVIFLTGYPQVSTAVRAMRGGALHYLEKPLREDDLWDAIQEAIAVDAERRHLRHRQQQLADRFAKLTIKEEHVLEKLLEGKSPRAIAKELALSVRTIELRRARLMKKLEIGSTIELVNLVAAIRNGHGSGNGNGSGSGSHCWVSVPGHLSHHDSTPLGAMRPEHKQRLALLGRS